MRTLFFDTETTGLANDKLDPTHPKQPMLVQLGCKLDGANRIERAACNLLVQPDGWTMDEGAKKATGLNEEIADEFGIHLITAVEVFLNLIDAAEVVVAHNASFDITVMRRNAFVYAQMTDQEYYDPFEGKTLICTMRAATPILQLPPLRRGEYKWPKLAECYRYYFNEELQGAHDALTDVRACARVYYEMLEQGVFAPKAA